jgi:phage terminase large subunit-like protein
VVGATKVHRVALADSVHVTRAKVDTAAAQSDSLIREAHRAVARSNGGREATRAVLAAADSTIPHSVIQAIDEQFARDSTTIAVQTSTIAELTTERGLRIQLDTLQQHQVDFTPPGDGISVTDVVVTVGIVATVVEAVRLVLQLLRH